MIDIYVEGPNGESFIGGMTVKEAIEQYAGQDATAEFVGQIESELLRSGNYIWSTVRSGDASYTTRFVLQNRRAFAQQKRRSA